MPVLDALSTGSPLVDHSDDLTAIARASGDVAADEVALAAAVEAARCGGRGRPQIALRPEVSPRAAWQRWSAGLAVLLDGGQA